ncbi:Helix-turn-helix domain-containing protein [Alkalithermobacter thermoalcaliphilus JW-YL-7 = DSM 7308]|uniref:Helix-turn-helix domain-containing protein n=1 Tax=Alkalithermobacter thermoalcaliphilus JW-YL-7 = DSM 7308 TaxID=1121328 RepID=A0A150FR18_CLOPD|nr:hypothetical protein JWYL7_1114 [[Clostridium] paradoxum JW-YL-7 = DSM 7308]SHL12713.1 Helix-turn-helix domain-containing protein [[Clostridium] paradoxum JW-YL-7 = DSM 7308]
MSIEVRREWHYTIVENHVLKSDISPHAKLLYVILCMYSNKEKECFPSYETLLINTGIKSRATLAKAIKQLKDVGILEVINRQKENASNIYIIKDNPVQNLNKASSINELGLVQNLNKASSPNEHELKTYNKNQKKLKLYNNKESVVDLKIKKVKEIIKEDLTDKEISSILKAAKNDIELIKEKYEIAKKNNYKNLVAFLIKAIKDNYAAPISNKVTKFHNFEQRTSRYTADELERIILDNQKRWEKCEVK